MKKLFKYWAIFHTSLVNSLAYPGEMIGRSLVILPFIWIFYQLWKVTFAAGGTDNINGMTLHDTLWYLMMAETIELGRPMLARVIADAVKDGSIAYLLNKPYDFIGYQFGNALGESVFRTLVNLVLGMAMTWWLTGPPPSYAGLLVMLPALLGSWVLNFCISALIGLAAFAVEDVTAFWWIYQKLAFLLGGLLIPLDFYPGWIQAIAKSLPFSAMVYAPSKLFIAPTAELFANTLLMQGLWIAVLGALLALVYRRGLAQLTVNGG